MRDGELDELRAGWAKFEHCELLARTSAAAAMEYVAGLSRGDQLIVIGLAHVRYESSVFYDLLLKRVPQVAPTVPAEGDGG